MRWLKSGQVTGRFFQGIGHLLTPESGYHVESHAVKRLLPFILIVIAILGYDQFYDDAVSTGGSRSPDTASSTPTTTTYTEWRSGQQVQGGGEVIRVLSDDNEGSRHQRFLIRINTGQTLLVAHNIDIAPRIPSLQIGDFVSFNGEYEWNDKGGVIHWTHRDLRGNHVSGWVQHDGKKYQ